MSETTSAEVINVMNSMGLRGVVRIRCKLLSGREKDKTLVRNVVGPVRKGDIILLKEIEMEFIGGMGGKR